MTGPISFFFQKRKNIEEFSRFTVIGHILKITKISWP